MRKVVKWLWVSFLFTSGSLWWAKRRLRGNGAVVTLLFHRVLDHSSFSQTLSQPEIIVTEETFRKLTAHIANKFDSVDLKGAAPGTPGRKPKVALTFDDGWKDNFTVAFPIIRKHRIPAVIFVTSALMDKENPFWPEQVIGLLREMNPSVDGAEIETVIESLKKCAPEEREKRLAELSTQAGEKAAALASSGVDRTLSWTEILEMNRNGVEIGSHTQTHQILTTVREDVARQEVVDSKLAIERALGKRCEVLAYPNGNWSPDTRNIVEDSGFKLAFTTEPGLWTAACDPLCVPRVSISEEKLVGPTGRFSPAMFEYMTIWKAWRATKANGSRARKQAEPSYALT